MLRLLRFLVLFFLLVAVPRVAAYASTFSSGVIFGEVDLSAVMAFSFALGLGAAVFLTTYASSLAMNRIRELEAQGIMHMGRRQVRALKAKETQTPLERERLTQNMEYEKVWSAFSNARNAAYLFAIIEGLFNLAEVLGTAIAEGLILSPVQPIANGWVDMVSVWIFALIPTISSIVLALVISSLDRARSSLDLSIDGILKDTANSAPQILPDEATIKETEELTMKAYPWLPSLEPNLQKHPKIVELRSRDKTRLSNKQFFMASMYNRVLQDLDTKAVAKDLGVTQRSVQRWVQEIEELRKEVNNGQASGV